MHVLRTENWLREMGPEQAAAPEAPLSGLEGGSGRKGKNTVSKVLAVIFIAAGLSAIVYAVHSDAGRASDSSDRA